MLANLAPTFTDLARMIFFVGEQEISITLMQETHGFGQRSEFYCLVNGFRIRPNETATTPQAGREWYKEVLSLYTQARIASMV